MNSTNKAFLVSIALHLALLVALAFLRLQFEPGIGADRKVVEVALVDSFGVIESLIPESDSDSAAGSAVEPAVELAVETPPPAQTEVPAEPDPVVETDPETEPVPAPPLEAIAEPEPEAIPEPAPPAPRLAEARPEALPQPAVPEETTTADNPEPEPETVPSVADVTGESIESSPREAIATAEAALIEKRVERWARGFAALGKWETATSWSDRDASYSAEVSHIPSTDGSGYDAAVVTVTTERDGQRLSTELRMQRLGFSHYAQFIDRWDPQVQIHDDRIEGRFHSNSEIYLQRTAGAQPTFLGKVTTATRVNTSRSDRTLRRSQVFLGGLEERVGRIPLPKSAALGTGGEIDSEHSLQLESDSRVRFLADGTLAWNRVDQPDNGSSFTLDPEEPFHIIAGEDASVHVSGTVNGRVLLYSADDIVIEGDLVYAAHPLDSESSDDYLGLVAEKSVDVAEPSITGSGDLEIHAAIYARRRFAVRSYRSRKAGTLTIIGSLTAGSLTATEPRFATNLRFDPRLADVRPPGFPVTDRYEIAEWDGSWSVASDAEPLDAGD